MLVSCPLTLATVKEKSNCQAKMSPMEGEKILMSQRQLQRWHLMGLVEGGKITLGEVCRRQEGVRRKGDENITCKVGFQARG